VLTKDLLKTLINYDPLTGIVTYIKPYRNFNRPSKNYLHKRIKGVKYAVHQLAFMYMTGSIPKLIDHIDGNIQNNAWSNLREASKSLNALNTSKSLGVYRSGKKWLSKCMVQKKIHYLGTFNTFIEAKEAYNNFKKGYICL
jgi:hypothetical protein